MITVRVRVIGDARPAVSFTPVATGDSTPNAPRSDAGAFSFVGSCGRGRRQRMNEIVATVGHA